MVGIFYMSKMGMTKK